MRNFQIEKMMGFWHIIEYYTSTEETPEYRCMQSELKITDQKEVSWIGDRVLHEAWNTMKRWKTFELHFRHISRANSELKTIYMRADKK